ncbi:MAG: DNA-directed RNA polymerase subunit alpha [Candidatus Rokubacteria bacterium]|nr:DNA-directed RNA polymerase subunit alpha [Candidatus Rokubacteria bacterium]
MPRIPFQKPRTVEWEILSERYGRLVAEPFERGYALTVGHSLRRTLLSIVPGSAVSWVKIDGVRSADAPIPGVKETTTDVLLNLKKLVIQVPSGEPRTVRVEVTGPKEVTGADVPETDLEVMNPEAHLFTLDAGARVSLELGIGMGRGYAASDRKPVGETPAGALDLDAAYSPITRVAYNAEPSRLGKITDYEKLVVEIWTNGAVSPDDALERAAGFLKGHFSPLTIPGGDDDVEAEGGSGEEYLREALGKPLEELPLPARAINALRNADLQLVADVVQKTEADLEHVKNLGEKSIDEIKTALAALGLSLGMRIDPNVLGALNRGGAAPAPGPVVPGAGGLGGFGGLR